MDGYRGFDICPKDLVKAKIKNRHLMPDLSCSVNRTIIMSRTRYTAAKLKIGDPIEEILYGLRTRGEVQ